MFLLLHLRRSWTWLSMKCFVRIVMECLLLGSDRCPSTASLIFCDLCIIFDMYRFWVPSQYRFVQRWNKLLAINPILEKKILWMPKNVNRIIEFACIQCTKMGGNISTEPLLISAQSVSHFWYLSHFCTECEPCHPFTTVSRPPKPPCCPKPSHQPWGWEGEEQVRNELKKCLIWNLLLLNSVFLKTDCVQVHEIWDPTQPITS